MNVTIGAGGSGGAPAVNGVDGGTTSVSGMLVSSATGGKGGKGAAPLGNGGDGGNSANGSGAGGGGSYNVKGANGTNDTVFNSGGGGGGCGSNYNTAPINANKIGSGGYWVNMTADGTNFLVGGGNGGKGLSSAYVGQTVTNNSLNGLDGCGGDGSSGGSGTFTAGKGMDGCVLIAYLASQTVTIINAGVTTKGLYNLGVTFPNYDSGWFNAAATNTSYTFTHNLGISLSYPPRVRILVSAVNNPVLGTNNVYEAQIAQCASNLGNPTNVGGGLNVVYNSANTIIVSTGNSFIYVDNGGTGVSIGVGYIRVYIYL